MVRDTIADNVRNAMILWCREAGMRNDVRCQAMHQQLDSVFHPIVTEGGYGLPWMLAFQSL